VRPKLVEGIMGPGEGGGLGTRQGYASFLTRRPPAKAGDLLSIRRKASWPLAVGPFDGAQDWPCGDNPIPRKPSTPSFFFRQS